MLLCSSDPYLAFLVRRDLPDADIVEANRPGDLPLLLRTPPDLAVADAADPHLDAISRVARRVVAVADRRGTRVPPGVEVLVRPLVPYEMQRAVRAATGDARTQARGHTWPPRLERLSGLAKLLAVLVGSGLELAAEPLTPLRGAVLAWTVVYAVALLRPALRPRWTAWLDVAFASAVIAQTGGVSSNFVLFGAIAAARAGLVLRGTLGALAGSAVAAGSLPSVAAGLGEWTVGVGQTVSWVLVFPITALTAGLAARLWLTDPPEASRLLVEANEVLSTLYRLARSLPAGLDLRSVAGAALDEVRDTLASPAAALLVNAASGTVAVAGSYGLASPEPVLEDELPSRSARAVPRSAMTPGLSRLLRGHESWVVAPLRHRGTCLGMLVAAAQCVPGEVDIVARLADETSLAVENAGLFSRVRRLSVDEERQRLARELHDGLAQELAHAKLELQLLTRAASAEAVLQEIPRLANLLSHAQRGVRLTIDGLRSVVDGGLAAALHVHAHELDCPGLPPVRFRAGAAAELPVHVENELFQIAKDAIGQAVRSRRASGVDVVLDVEDACVRLTVSDDGDPRPASEGLAHRAARIGGRVRSGTGPGNRVEIVVPRLAAATTT